MRITVKCAGGGVDGIARSRGWLCGFIVLMKSLEAVKALDLLKLVTQYHDGHLSALLREEYTANHKSYAHTVSSFLLSFVTIIRCLMLGCVAQMA